MELSEGSFQEVMNAESKPLVVLISVTTSGTERDRIIEMVRSLAAQWRRTGATQYTPAQGARQVVFVWMDQERWASWLKSMYGVKGPTQVVIVDHSRLVYFDSTRTGSRLTLDDAIILPALGDAMKGTLNVRHSENIVERIVRHINNKLLAIERMVREHPWTTLSFFALGILAVFWIVRRLLTDEDNYHYKSEKEARLD